MALKLRKYWSTKKGAQLRRWAVKGFLSRISVTREISQHLTRGDSIKLKGFCTQTITTTTNKEVKM